MSRKKVQVVESEKQNASKARKELDDDTTVDQLWELLTQGAFSLDVADFVDIYGQCERKGLGSDIAEVIPQQIASAGVTELRNVSLSQVTSLIYALMDSDEDRETILQNVQETSFGVMDYKAMMRGRHDDMLRLKHFRALFPCLSQLLQIDMCYIITWFVWHLKERFEMPASLYSAVVERVRCNRQKGMSGQDVFTRLQTSDLEESSGLDIDRNDFTRMFHTMQLSVFGCPYEKAQRLFEDTIRNMASLLARRVETQPGMRRAAVDAKSLQAQVQEKRIVGRTQTTILFHEIFSALPDGGFRSPIDLAVAFIQGPDITEEQREAIAAAQPEERAKSPKDGTRKGAAPKRRDRRAATAPPAVLAARSIEFVQPDEFNHFVSDLKDRFRILDVNGDGFLDFEELSELLRETNPEAVDEERIRDIFSALDGSGDGLIAFDEFVTYISPEKPEAARIKVQFDKLDTNGDGQLDFSELCSLLQRGNPGIKEHEVRLLFDEADLNDDGVVDFSEFVSFIFSMDGRSKSSVKKTRQAAAAAKQARDEANADLADVKPAFLKISGRDAKMNGNELSKLCKECGLFDRGFAFTDVDVIFAKVVKKGERTIGLKQFKACLKHVADKKGCALGEVHALIAKIFEEEGGAKPNLRRSVTMPARVRGRRQ